MEDLKVRNLRARVIFMKDNNFVLVSISLGIEQVVEHGWMSLRKNEGINEGDWKP